MIMSCLSCLLLFVFLLCPFPALAHFGMLIPSTDTPGPRDRTLTLILSFSHPFEKIGMDLARPQQCFAVNRGKRTDLLPLLQPFQVMEHQGWQAHIPLRRPGVYQLVMQPVPYWEPAEELFIIHYTKTVVAAFGAEEGWEKPVGLPTEIVPLTRPFGNYAGNSFTGQVLLHGKPAAGTMVEVEYFNQQERHQAPSPLHITQVVRTDERGYFTFTCPWPGWWGFAALSEDGTIRDAQGIDRPVELGAVLWLHFVAAPK